MSEINLFDTFEHNHSFYEGAGFPKYPIMAHIDNLGKETHFMKPGRRVRKPHFTNKHVLRRQEIFKKVEEMNFYEIKEEIVSKNIKELDSMIKKGMEEVKKFNPLSYQDLASKVLLINEKIKETLIELGDCKEIFCLDYLEKKMGEFEENLENGLKQVVDVHEHNTFYIDIRKGTVVPTLDEVDEKKALKDFFNFYYGESQKYLRNITQEIRKVSKKSLIEYKLELNKGLRTNLWNYVEKEYSLNGDCNGIISHYDIVNLPFVLGNAYYKAIKQTDWRLSREETDEWYDLSSTSINDLYFIPTLKFPKFGDSYKVKGLFPPAFILPNDDSPWRAHQIVDDYTPIEFELNIGEKKVLLVGLHSGGKSFLVENLILASILAQMGLPLPTEEQSTLPLFEHVYYENGGVRSSRGGLESMLSNVGDKVRHLKENDLIVIDELLSPARPEVVPSIGPKILDKILNAPGTAIIIDHRIGDYEKLVEKGWTLMTPGYKREGNKVVPTYKIERGIPDPDLIVEATKNMVDRYFG